MYAPTKIGEKMISTLDYIDKDELHAILMYSPEQDRIQTLETELLTTQVELIHANCLLHYYKTMYEKLDSYRSKR